MSTRCEAQKTPIEQPTTKHPKKYQGIPFTRHETRRLKEAGFSTIMISFWRTGRHRPSLENAKRIAAITGRPLLELVYGGPVWKNGEEIF